jgi:hypothetical protein
MVVPLDGSSPIALDRDVLGIPDDDDPEMSLLRDHRGSWHAERLDGEGLELQDGTVFEAAGRQWQFTLGDGIGPTSVLPNPQCPCPIFLRFSVSKDEEYVELRAEQEGRTIEIGSRAHNYLLLTLARFRLQDAGRDILSSARGWTYVEDLERALKTTAIRINTDVFRIRQHFAKLGLGNAVNIIERRHRAKQLRIGTESVQIVVI